MDHVDWSVEGRAVRIMYLTVLAAAVAASTMLAHHVHMEGRLLRTDPDMIAQSADLMQFSMPRGAYNFRRYCGDCHGSRGRGDPSRGIPNLADGDWLYGSGMVSEIERIVAYGIRSDHPKAWNLAIMPAFAHARPSGTDPKIPPLSPPELRDVIEYLIYLQQKTADPQAAARGAKVYGIVGGCYDCHSADAKGDSAIGAPNLVDAITLYGDGSRQALLDSIANGRQGVCPAWINRLRPATMREIATYVYSLSHAGKAETSP
jgi:cytochrome c oxidase cbb3-type subunit 3